MSDETKPFGEPAWIMRLRQGLGEAHWLSTAIDEFVAEIMAASKAMHSASYRLGLAEGTRDAEARIGRAKAMLIMASDWITDKLAEKEWKPSRAHIEGGRNTMKDVLDVLGEHRTTAVPEGDGWRPISGAPKNGTPFFVQWAGEHLQTAIAHIEDDDVGYLTDDMAFYKFNRPPTHYLPLDVLPPAPSLPLPPHPEGEA